MKSCRDRALGKEEFDDLVQRSLDHAMNMFEEEYPGNEKEKDGDELKRRIDDVTEQLKKDNWIKQQAQEQTITNALIVVLHAVAYR